MPERTLTPLSYVDLQGCNTLKVPATAVNFWQAKSEQQLAEIGQLIQPESWLSDWYCLGGGSNLVIVSTELPNVLQPNLKGIQEIERSDLSVTVEVAAGVNWHEWVLFCATKGWYGLENLALIPGSVGAAPVQNIGAYGVEVAELIQAVRVYDIRSKAYQWLENSTCRFSYRDSLFKSEAGKFYIIVAVRFQLSLQFMPNLSYQPLADQKYCMKQAQDLINLVCKIRSSKLPDPSQIPNVGSFFKNPVISNSKFRQLQENYPSISSYPQENNQVKIPAAWLIEQAGLKGYIADSGVGMHHQQALVLVNSEGAAGRQVLEFSSWVKQQVQSKFAISLMQEPVIW